MNVNVRQLLKDLYRERRDAINAEPARVAIRRLPPATRALVGRYRALVRDLARVSAKLAHAGIPTHTIQSTTVRPVPRNTQKHRELLASANRACELALLKAGTPKERAAAIEQFIHATRSIVQ